MRRTWLLVLALLGCRREPTREQVIAPLYRDHRALPELPGFRVERCEDVTTVVVTREGVHVDATAIGAPIPWAKRRDALPEELKLDWPLAQRNVVKLRDALFPLDSDHEQRILRDVLTQVTALQRALPSEPRTMDAIVTVSADVPVETTMRTYVEAEEKLSGTVALATSAGCILNPFPRVADARARVRITALSELYATTTCKADAAGKLGYGGERWTADQVKNGEVGGVVEYCAPPLERTLDVLVSYGRLWPTSLGPAPPFVTAARPRQ